MGEQFADLPREHYGAILVDPPWRFRTWDNRTRLVPAHSTPGIKGCAATHYDTMSIEDICALPVADLALPDCSLFTLEANGGIAAE